MTLIRHHVETLHLRPQASFPSQAQDAMQLIKDWRYEQRCKLVCRNGVAVGGVVSDDCDDVFDLGE